MSGDNNSNSASSLFISSEVSIPRTIRFWLMLLFDIPSIICSFCLIFHIMMNRNQRQALHNHSIFLILVFGLPIQLMDINFYLVFFQYGSVQPSKPIICLLWWLADYGFYIGGIILMTWLAIERHILIFYDRWVANRRGRFLFHYLPLILQVTYICLFYIIVIFILPCENVYDYTVPVCGASPCYQSYGILSMWEFIVNTSIPILLEGIFSVGLVVRVQWQKRRLQQSAQWRKHRRMMIQLFLISGLNISLNLPISLIPLAHFCGLPPEYGVQAQLQTFNHHSISFEIRELIDEEMKTFCSDMTLYPSIINEFKKFTSYYEIRTCYYLDSSYNWEFDGLLVGPSTNHYQTQCFLIYLTTFSSAFLFSSSPINYFIYAFSKN